MSTILVSKEYTKLIIDSFIELVTLDYEIKGEELIHFKELMRQSKFCIDIDRDSDHHTHRSFPDDVELRGEEGTLSKVTQMLY